METMFEEEEEGSEIKLFPPFALGRGSKIIFFYGISLISYIVTLYSMLFVIENKLLRIIWD